MEEHKNKNKNLKEDVYEKIFKAIVKGNLVPGERIIEKEIANKMSISRTPVRQALKKLEEQKLIEISPYKGAIVKDIGYDETIDLLKTREVIETYLCKEAAKKITKKEITKLNEILNSYEKAYENHNYEEMLMKNFEFHTYIAQISDNKVAEDIYENLRARLNILTSKSLPFADRDLLTFEEHRKIVEALENKDTKKVIQSIKNHNENIKEVLLKRFKSKEGIFNSN